jgi:hypothetical protein
MEKALLLIIPMHPEPVVVEKVLQYKRLSTSSFELGF